MSESNTNGGGARLRTEPPKQPRVFMDATSFAGLESVCYELIERIEVPRARGAMCANESLVFRADDNGRRYLVVRLCDTQEGGE